MDYHLTLLSILEKVKPELESISEADFTAKPNPLKWSKLEILGHLVDSAFNNQPRFVNAPLKSDLIFSGYDQDHWVKHNDYQNRNSKEVISLFFAAQTHIFYSIAGLDHDVLNRLTSEHNFHEMAMKEYSKIEPAKLADLISDYLFHLEHHLSQIIPNYKPVSNSK